jgi:26S proteasome regulatory subunit N9
MASMQVDNVDPTRYIESIISTSPPELHPFLQKFLDQYQRKLWHQLTLELFKFFAQPSSAPYHVDVFNKFVRDFESRLNQLKLAEMGVKVSRQLDDLNDIMPFFQSLISRISKTDAPDAYVLLLASLAHAKLLFGDMEGTKTDMDECGKMLDDLDSVAPHVPAAYYSVAADYHKAKAEYAPYYKHSLLYLACVNPETDLTLEDRRTRAHDLAISALLGDTIYNFGELLMHPILDSLDETPFEWIKRLLFAFNEGNIGKFEALSPHFSKQPILQENYPFLRQKICLMALIEAVFKRSALNRTMTFQAISEETKLPRDEVEHLVMKALSLKLIRGRLDQVEEKAHISWVQPRVLSKEQIGELAERLTTWCEKLQKVETFTQAEMQVGA